MSNPIKNGQNLNRWSTTEDELMANNAHEKMATGQRWEEMPQGTIRQLSDDQNDKVTLRQVWSEGVPVYICTTGTLRERLVCFLSSMLFVLYSTSLNVSFELPDDKGLLRNDKTIFKQNIKGSGGAITDGIMTASYDCVRVEPVGPPGRLRSASVCGTVHAYSLRSSPLPTDRLDWRLVVPSLTRATPQCQGASRQHRKHTF